MYDYSAVTISLLPGNIRVRKKPGRVSVAFADQAGRLQTLEGMVPYQKGDAIVTGLVGEQWPVSRNVFLQKYTPAEGLLSGEDGTYEKEIIWAHAVRCEEVKCRVTMRSGGILLGKEGDWVLQYNDGDYGIVAGELFNELYEVVH